MFVQAIAPTMKKIIYALSCPEKQAARLMSNRTCYFKENPKHLEDFV